MKTQNTPEFLMLVGLPGSGKSTYAAELEKNGYTWLSSDTLRTRMGYGPGEGSSVVFSEMVRLSKAALDEGHSVVFDATNTSRKHRVSVLKSLERCPGTRSCLLFTEPFEECLKRNSQRTGDALVPSHAMDKMLKSFQVPMEQEGFSKISVVQTTKGAPLESYLEMARGFSQDNRHHELTLLEHLKDTMERLCAGLRISGGPQDAHRRFVLRDAALYHDIGKLFTKQFKDSKGDPSDDAHFYSHENAGAYVYLSADKSRNNSITKEDELRIAQLINWHMRPYVEMKDSKRNAERAMLGEDFWEDLQRLHEADDAAHRKSEKSAEAVCER